MYFGAARCKESSPQWSSLCCMGRSEHTLPITGLYCGMGANPIVVTVSLDCSCKIWSLAQGLHFSHFISINIITHVQPSVRICGVLFLMHMNSALVAVGILPDVARYAMSYWCRRAVLIRS